ncbi:hypothetical protein EDEG_03689 [Edhazardia aedis USNM 41457]|uniref:Uncharacterized protein n=1 Tax=Edhazardia aedis (strain USNM 41457) TaxID=1003232 RepID=J9D2L8_EDHAE|nr:hypothetical protein EDEG_03689 [Edhazardia aedis USNM 41457]|eukprot:EJW01829.1 hypothetical protein EDEG_03689 [Edhazardia aedis USNM 41457]
MIFIIHFTLFFFTVLNSGDFKSMISSKVKNTSENRKKWNNMLASKFDINVLILLEKYNNSLHILESQKNKASNENILKSTKDVIEIAKKFSELFEIFKSDVFIAAKQNFENLNKNFHSNQNTIEDKDYVLIHIFGDLYGKTQESFNILNKQIEKIKKIINVSGSPKMTNKNDHSHQENKFMTTKSDIIHKLINESGNKTSISPMRNFYESFNGALSKWSQCISKLRIYSA